MIAGRLFTIEVGLKIRTHSDTTLALLKRGGHVSADEEKVLGPWEWSQNEAFLHWDERVSPLTNAGQAVLTMQLMPIRRRAFSGRRLVSIMSAALRSLS